MGTLHVLDHPLLQHKLSILRDRIHPLKNSASLSANLHADCYEATRDLPVEVVEVETPVAPASEEDCRQKLAVVPILRAGVGIVDGFLTLVPSASGPIGIGARIPSSLLSTTALPKDISDRDVYIIDPMLATGSSATSGCSVYQKLWEQTY